MSTTGIVILVVFVGVIVVHQLFFKKASDADKTPKELKDKWRERILEVQRNETTSQNLSGSGD